jgi:SAM-dependent methyltransferase
MQKEIDNWFTSWFDSPYYHILYKDRDNTEAEMFMKSLSTFLNLRPEAEILDLACGKGRHSKSLNELGYHVTGVDLSPTSIRHAKQFENDRLHFIVHDMSQVFPKRFDAVFNLFTSFGYFDDEKDNLRTIKAIKEELKSNGYGVIDFLNLTYVAKNLVPIENKTINNICFRIERSIENGYIIKNISFEDQGNKFNYTEKVKALTLKDFKSYFDEAGVSLKNCLGDYHLNEFDVEVSERLILIFN